MIKATVLAFTLALSSCVGTTAFAQTFEECDNVSIIIGEVAKMRDVGIPNHAAMNLLVEVGLPIATATTMVMYVYQMHPDKDPETLQAYFFNLCVSEAA